MKQREQRQRLEFSTINVYKAHFWEIRYRRQRAFSENDWAKFGNNDGFHGGASLITVTRTADIRKATRGSPLAATDVDYNNGWAWEVDGFTANNCSDFCESSAQSRE